MALPRRRQVCGGLVLLSFLPLAGCGRKAPRAQAVPRDATVLARYERAHWLASRPTYLATQLVTHLYTHETAPSRLLRQAALRIGQRFAPFRRAVAASLTGA